MERHLGYPPLSSPDKKLKRSRFAQFYVRGDDICLFHSLSRDVVFGNSTLLSMFLSFPDSGSIFVNHASSPVDEYAVALLVQKGLLVECSQRDDELLSKLRSTGKNLHAGRLSHMYFVPSTSCNISCKYCFVEESMGRYREMTEDTARKAISYFFKHSNGSTRRRITFYGGEPLLNLPAVLAAADKAIELNSMEDSPVSLSLILITNGTLVTDDVAVELVARQFTVSVSIDGPNDVHDSYRQTRKGESTFEAARKGFLTLKDHGIRPGISCTITPGSLERWDDVVNFFNNELTPQGLGFNLLHPQPSSKYPIDYVSNRVATDAIIQAFERFRESGLYEDRVMRRVKPFVSKKFHFKDCLGVGGQIVVAPDGSIGPCQALLGHDTFFPLNVEHDIETSPYNNSLFEEWTERFPLNIPECLTCPAIAICGGGCPVSAIHDSGSMWAIDRRVCDQVKPIHEWLVWDLFKHSKQSGRTT